MSDDVTTDEGIEDAEGDRSGSRRSFLTKGAAAAAAAAAAGVAMSSSAGAANGDTMYVGTAHTGTSQTSLTGSTFNVTNGNGIASIIGTKNTLNGIGVYGVAGQSSEVGTGVRGYALEGQGVHGIGGDTSTGAIGLRGTSDIGPPLHLDPVAGDGPPAGTWNKGDFFVGDDGLWYATASGSGAAAGWVKLSSVLTPLDSPLRAYDSRPGQLPATGPKTKIVAGENRDVDLTSASLLPGSAQAALINLTVTNTSSGGFLKVFKKGAAIPTASNINWSSAGQTIANSTLVALDSAGRITVRCGGGGAQTDFIVDILAFSV